MDVAKSKQPAPAKTVEQLVERALKLIVQNPEAKWLGKSDKAIFNEKDPNCSEAIKTCAEVAEPLLRKVGDKGALTTAGFARVSSFINEDELVLLAKSLAFTMDVLTRVQFLEDIMSINETARSELKPLYEAAVESEQQEVEKRIAETAKAEAKRIANEKATEEFLAIIRQRGKNKIDALRREWELLGQKPSDLPAHKPAIAVPPATPPTPLVARTAEEKDFCRDVVDRLAASWRDAWDKDLSSCEFLETAMWNISGMRMIGEKDAKVAFDGRYHESRTPLFTNDAAKIERPGWLLKIDAAEYVALKAAVTKA